MKKQETQVILKFLCNLPFFHEHVYIYFTKKEPFYICIYLLLNNIILTFFVCHPVFFTTTLGSIAFVLCFFFFFSLTDSIMSILQDKSLCKYMGIFGGERVNSQK